MTVGRLLYAKAFVATGEPLANGPPSQIVSVFSFVSLCDESASERSWAMADGDSLTRLSG